MPHVQKKIREIDFVFVFDTAVVNVSVAEAKSKLTQLLRAVQRGEQVTICRHGKAIVELVPASATAIRTAPKPPSRDELFSLWLQGDL
jgi:prevent-host-death family protein